MPEKLPKLEIITKLAQDGGEHHFIPNVNGTLSKRLGEDEYNDLNAEFDVTDVMYDTDGSLISPEPAVTEEKTPVSAPVEPISYADLTEEQKKAGRDSRKNSQTQDLKGREDGKSGFKSLDEATQTHLDKSATERQKKEAKEALETRRNSAEVSRLNDTAELRIYGSRGRDYTHKINGEDKLIANADNSTKSAHDRIMDDPRYGASHKDRKEFADAYDASINDILSRKDEVAIEGRKDKKGNPEFELTQAEFLTSLRMEDLKALKELDQRELETASKMIAGGMDKEQALEKANALFSRLRANLVNDTDRLKIVQENGLMTRNEYEAYLESKKPAKKPVDTPEPVDTPDADPADKPFELMIPDDQEAKLAELRLDAQAKFDRYIELSTRKRMIGRGLRKEYKLKAVEDALNEFNEANDSIGYLVGHLAREQDATPEDMIALARAGWTMTNDAKLEALNAKAAELSSGSKFLGRFNDWFTRQTAEDENGNRPKFGKTKKFAAMAALGFGTGAITGAAMASTFLTLGASAVVPGFFMGRYAKGQMLSKITKDSKDTAIRTQAGVHNAQEHSETQKQIDGTALLVGTDQIMGRSFDKTKEYSRKNQKRVIGAAALGLIFGTAGHFSGDIYDAFKDAPTPKLDFSMPNLDLDMPDWVPGFDDGYDANLPEGIAPEVNPDDISEIPGAGQINGTVPESTIPNPGFESPTSATSPIPGGTVDSTALEDSVQPGVDANAFSSENLIGNDFDIQSGNGFISEMKEAAEANGISLNDDQANQVFSAVRERMGDDLLTAGEYVQDGDLRISGSGANQWNPGVLQAIMEESQKVASQGAPTLPASL